MSTYDLRNMNTKEDFDTLIRGLMEVATDKGYVENLRNLARGNQEWGKHLADTVIVKGEVPFLLSPTYMGEKEATILRTATGNPNAGYTTTPTIYVQTTLIIKPSTLGESAVHMDGRCVDNSLLYTLVKGAMADRLADTPGAYAAAPEVGKLSTACFHPDCPYYL